MEIFLSNYAIIYYLYSTELPGWVEIIKFVFELYPPFNFSKAYSDIANKSASHFDNYEWRWIEVSFYIFYILINYRVKDINGVIYLQEFKDR
jgi:hypothetical protein